MPGSQGRSEAAQAACEVQPESRDLRAMRHVQCAHRTRPPRDPVSMVRRGSTVRVRQRASRNALQNGYLSCLSGKRLSRAGTRGHYLVFPRQRYRQVVFGLIKRIRTDLTPSVPRRDAGTSPNRWGQIEMSRKSGKLASRMYRLCGEPVRPSSALNLSVAFGWSDAHARTVP